MKLLKAEAGVNDGKAGLLSAAGLFAKGGIFDKKSESFNIQELDPYLLFDARSSMLGTLENPTLDLDPATPSTLDVITATRSSVATRTLPDGTIALAEQDTVRVDYTQGEQLTPAVYQHFGQTNFDDPAWQKITTSITADDALAPDGTATADRMVIPLAANSQSSRLTEESNITSGTTVTISFYVKADGSINPLVLFANGSVFARILFDLPSKTSSFVDGALTITHSIEEASNGFYRCSATFTSAGIGSISIRNATAGDGVSSLLLWGPQLEEGTTASDFVENTTGSPKFITGATYGPRVPMILVEPSATNLVEYSEDFSHSSWLKNGVGTGVAPVVTLNAAESPDGTQNATKIVFDAGSGTLSEDLSILEDFFNSTSGTSYTQSVYLKGENGGEQILLRNAGLSAYTTITLTTEWARYDVTETATLSFGYFSMGLRQGLGGVVLNSSITVYAYGAQVEAGSVATSLIPTSGGDAAARTRAADDLVISGSDFDFYNASEGTFYVEGVPRSLVNGRYLTVSDATSYNRVILYEGGGLSRFFVAKDDATQAYLGNTASSINTLNRIAASYKLNNFLTSANGTQFELPVTSGTPPTSVNRMNVGSNETGLLQLNGHIKRLIYWPYHSDSL